MKNVRLNIVVLCMMCSGVLGHGVLGHLYSQQASTPKKTVRLGMEVASDNNFAIFNGKKLGLIVNHSSLNSKGEHLADILAEKKLAVKLFAPEHGIRGTKDEENLKDETDSKTGLPVISLYKANKKAPEPADLVGVDALVFDIQEIGVRYYTYASTMALAMQAAAKAGIEFYVLDRPNPAMPLGAYGPLLDKEFEGGFISMYPIPLSHGLTIGELASYYNTEFGIKCKLKVITMQGYNRSMYYDDTKLPWRNPSPNIRSMDAVIAYHIFGWMEYLNISVGRGTTTPFLLYGNPSLSWIPGKITMELLNQNLPGLRFDQIQFKPESSKFTGLDCRGFKVVITERSLLEPQKTMISVAHTLAKYIHDSTRTKEFKAVGKTFGNRELLEMIQSRQALDKIMEKTETLINKPLQAFIARSTKYMLYPKTSDNK